MSSRLYVHDSTLETQSSRKKRMGLNFENCYLLLFFTYLVFRTLRITFNLEVRSSDTRDYFDFFFIFVNFVFSRSFCVFRDFLRFQAKLQGLKIHEFWGVFKIKKDYLYHVIELFKLSKKVYYIKVSTFLDLKLLAYL